MRIQFGILAALLAASSSLAQTGVNDDRVSLPEGPGSLEGIGDNASINANMGSMSFSVPIAVPEGFGGVTPSLSLDYSSAAPMGISGIGWDLAVPFIERMTNLRLPEYNAADDIVANGGQQLVRVARDADFAEYRARFEGGFSRYRWHDGADGRGYWTEETPEGITRYYGATRAGGRVEDAQAIGRGAAIFRWHLVETVDRFGHRARYDYLLLGGLPHLERIQYIFTSGQPTAEVRFAYEEREDRLSDARSGRNEVRTHRLTTVDVYSDGTRMWRYALAYEPYADSGGLSRLRRVERFGVGDEPHPIAFDFEYSRTLGAVCEVGCEAPYLTEMGSIGVNLGSGEATLIDLNGDALPDIVDSAQPGALRVFLNEFRGRGEHSFRAGRRAAAGTQASHQISSPYVQTLDVNGDGRADLANVRTGQVLFNTGSGDWAPPEALDEVADLPDFGEEFAVGAEELTHVRFFDYDNDRKIDVLRSTDVITDIYRNQGAAGFALAEGVEGIGAGFADQRLELADLNGDGLLDPVLIRPGEVSYRVNLGFGRWTAWRELSELPFNAAEIEFVELEDVNGDSLDDIVIVQAGSLSYALNRGGDRFDAAETLVEAGGRALPQRVDGTTVLFADMNGSGSDDVVWVTAAGAVTYLELFPLRPNLLTRITNGLGLVTDVGYRTSVEMMAEAEGGWRYTLPFPMIMAASIDTYDALNDVHALTSYTYRDAYYDPVDKALRGFERVEVQVEGDETQQGSVARKVYDLGVADPYRKGLLLSDHTLSLEGGQTEPMDVVTNTYDDCPVAGVDGADGPWAVRYVCRTATETVVQEGAAEPEWVTLREELSYDGYGNVVAEAKLGVVDGPICGACDRPEGLYGAPCGDACEGDERYRWTEFATPRAEGRWMLRLPVQERASADPDAGEYTEKLTFYDGEPFVGLARGEFTDGLASRVTERVDADTVVTSARSRYDEHGNIVESISANGAPGRAGHRTHTTYDDEHLLITRTEFELLDADGAPYRLRRSYTYDAIWGQPASATGWVMVRDGEELTTLTTTRYAYDALGRPVRVARPGDALDRPTTEWRYTPGDPVSEVEVRQRSHVGAGLPDIQSVHCFDGFGRKYQARDRVLGGGYEVDQFSARNRRGEVVAQHRAYRDESGACDLSAPDDFAVRSRRDVRGRPITETYPDEAIYGAASRARKTYDPLVAWDYGVDDSDPDDPGFDTPTVRRYDGQLRVVAVAYGMEPEIPGPTWQVYYDVYGNLAGLTDPAGNLRRQRYDAAGRVVSVDDPNRGQLRYVVDAEGNRLRSEDDAGRVVVSVYDAAGRVTAQWGAEDPEGTRIEHGYDDPALCSGDCDNTANQTVVSRYPGGALWLTYDERQRQTSRTVEIDGRSFTTTYRYDNLDRRIGATLPDGTALRYTLDTIGRVTAIEDFIDEVSYDHALLVDRVTFANGVSERRAYDVIERMTGLEVIADEETLLDLQYTHSRLGLIREIADGSPVGEGLGHGARYSYDALARVTRAELDFERPDFAEEVRFEYDVIDNLVQRTSSRGEGSPAHLGALLYGEGGAGPNAVTRAGDRVIAYDAAGFVTRRDDVDLSWDAFGRLTHAWRGEALLLRSRSGAEADRIVVEEGPGFNLVVGPDFEIEDGMALTHVRLGDRLVATRESADLAARVLSDLAPADGDAALTPDPDGTIDAADAIISGRVEAGAELVSEGTPDPVRRLLRASARRTLLEGAPRVLFHHRDHAGNSAVVTDADAAVVERNAWFPFGLVRAGAEASRWSNASRQMDRSTGLHFYGARYYDPTLGRWLSPDPAFDALDAEQGAGRLREATGAYVYNLDNPIAFEDLDGRTSWLKRQLRKVGAKLGFGSSASGNNNSASGAGLAPTSSLSARNARADRSHSAIMRDLRDLQAAAAASSSVDSWGLGCGCGMMVGAPLGDRSSGNSRPSRRWSPIPSRTSPTSSRSRAVSRPPGPRQTHPSQRPRAVEGARSRASPARARGS